MLISVANFLSTNSESDSISTYRIADERVHGLKNINDLVQFQVNINANIRDRSLNYGDGCFTTIYAKNNSVSLFEEHVKRLVRDGQHLGICINNSVLKTVLVFLFTHYLNQHELRLKRNCNKTKRGIQKHAIAIKVLLSRGEGGRGYMPPQNQLPHLMISFQETVAASDINLLSTYDLQAASMKLSVQPLLAGLKHNNRLEQVMAKQELSTRKTDDLILCNQLGSVIEATASNVFLHTDDGWHTPKLDNSGVAGVMRAAILKYMSEHKISHHISDLRYDSMLNATAMFTCNALTFIKPVTSFTCERKSIRFDMNAFPSNLNGFFSWLSQYNSHLANNLAEANKT